MMIINTPRVSNWNVEKGYGSRARKKDEYPLRVYNSEHGAGLNLHLQLYERDLETLCRGVAFIRFISYECMKIRNKNLFYKSP